MNRAMKMLMLGVGLAVVLYACKNDEQGATQGEGVISGTVTDRGTGAVLTGVTVQAQSVSAAPKGTITDGQGQYRFTFTTDSAKTITVSFVKSGYRDTSFVAQITPGTVTPGSIGMNAKSPISVGGGSGIAQTIAFLGANPRELTVYGVGGTETAVLGFEVRDSLGFPIDAAHAVNIGFSIANGPNGGEYISPISVRTNQVGQAYTTFNSGIRSGVVQVLASATVGSRTISLSPIRLVIDAGYPDQAHFTVGPERHNFPSLLFVFGLRDRISVLVGDKYSNPVAANTALYLRTAAGVIVASIFTNATGEGTADLISGNPQPILPNVTTQYGEGYHYVVARTVGEAGVTVRDSTLILWSSLSQIKNISPSTFDIPNGGNTTVSFNVSDYLNHPLAAGTGIGVTVSIPPPPCPDCPQNQVLSSFGAGGSGSVVLGDELFGGPGSTDFSFTLSDGTSNIIDSVGTAVTVNISVAGPNGNVTSSIVGRVH